MPHLNSPSRFLLVLFCVVLLFCGSATAQGQNSTPILPQQTNPFEQPLKLSTLLLQQIDSGLSSMQTLQQQIIDLQATLQEQGQAIQAAQVNSVELQASLDKSESIRLTQEQQLKASMTSLKDSQKDLQKASTDAKVLEAQVGILRIGCVTLGITLSAAAIYGGGHLLKVW
jgi:chromosome condensin MukBEF ATPase and DNA-binding subunit MukB